MRQGKLIYIIRPVGQQSPVKIGVSTRVERRLEDLQAASPVKLEVIATMSGGHETEKFLHNRFDDARLHGEWFEVDEHMQTFIDEAMDGVLDFSFVKRKPRAKTQYRWAGIFA